MKILRDRAATRKKGSEKRDLKNHDEKNGCRYRRGVGAMRAWSVQGASVPKNLAEEQPEKAKDRGYERAGPAAAK